MAVIGISGKIGSGKDTVGSIIQYLTAGDVGSDCIKRIRGGLPIYGYHNSKCEVKKFAGKLKQIASLLTGVPVEMFESQEFKKRTMDEMWWYWSDSENVFNRIPYTSSTKILEKFDGNLILYKPTYREFLQELGTDAMRDGLHTNVWVNSLFADYKPQIYRHEVHSRAAGFIDQEVLPNWILTDMRFPNEMEAVKERKGITIRVVRPYDYSKGIKKSELDDILNTTFNKIESPYLHPSETALDDAEFDYTIENSGSIDELIEKVKAILIVEKIIK